MPLIHILTVFATWVTFCSSGNVAMDAIMERERATVLRPEAGEAAIVVTVHVFIYDLEIKSDYLEVAMKLSQSWRDPRLAHELNSHYLHFKADQILQKIWSPDLFWQNAVEPAEVLNPGFVRIYPNGEVTYSQFSKESLRCWNASTVTPFTDCCLKLSSFGSTIEEILIDPRSQNPIQWDDDVERFSPVRIENVSVAETQRTTSISMYDSVNFCLKLSPKR